MTPTPKRREGRRLAMLAIFAQNSADYDLPLTLSLMRDMNPKWQTLPPFTVALCEAVERHREEISVTLTAILEHWKLDRVAPVERAILQLACAEIDYFPDIPPRVTITEYLELAKAYAPEQAPGFINGILDRLVHLRGKEDFQAGKIIRRAGH